VRSLTLDKWDPETVALLQAVGNHRSNVFFEQNGVTIPRPTAKSDREARVKFIQAKYIDRDFASKSHLLTPPSILSRKVYEQTVENNSPNKILEMVISGADVNWADPETSRTALMAAVASNNFVVAELLMLNGADPMVMDTKNGYSALHYAALHNNLQMASLLLRRKGPELLPLLSLKGQTALDLADSSQSLDVLALLKSYQIGESDPVIIDAVLQSYRTTPSTPNTPGILVTSSPQLQDPSQNVFEGNPVRKGSSTREISLMGTHRSPAPSRRPSALDNPFDPSSSPPLPSTDPETKNSSSESSSPSSSSPRAEVEPTVEPQNV